MNHKRNRNQGNNDAAKLNTPPRETSESTDLNEIEKLLATQRQTDEEIAQKKESLRARLNLLEEAVAGRNQETGERREEQGVRKQESEGEIERLKKEIKDLSAENLALQETKEKNIEKNDIVFLVFVVFVTAIAFLALGLHIGEWTHQRQEQQQHEERQVVPVPEPLPMPEPPGLAMTKEEARLTRQGIERVRRDVISGGFHSAANPVQSVMNALYAAVPPSVQEAVLKEFGTPDMDSMEEALDILEGKLP